VPKTKPIVGSGLIVTYATFETLAITANWTDWIRFCMGNDALRCIY